MASLRQALERQADPYAALSEWVVQQGLHGHTAEHIFEGFGKELLGVGLPIQRAYTAMRVLHPLYSGFGLIWRREIAGAKEELFGASPVRSEAWLKSPLKPLVEDGVAELRRRITGPEAGVEFPILEDLRRQGATDYYATVCAYGFDGAPEPNRGVVFSWTTDRPEGFADHEVALLGRVAKPLALALRVAANRRLASGLASVYLGKDAGRRVLSGEITRGAAETIRAVLLFGDLRGFTTLADRLPRDLLIATLNDYLESMALPVEGHGGQVLKFMGDGMLGTFATAPKGEGAVCVDALNAALEAQGRVEALNRRRQAEGKPVLTLDLGLHLGDVLYGNVGSPTRLDFTVVGPAVNEASRLEAACKALDRSILISRAFKDAMPDADRLLLPLGRYGLRSVREPVELFTVERIPEWQPTEAKATPS